MDYVLLDTSILVNCTLTNAADADPEVLATIVRRIRDRKAQLLLPDVVRFEYERKVPEELAFIRQQTKKFRDSVSTQILTAPDVSELHATLDRLESERTAAVERAQEYFREVAEDSETAVRVPLDGQILSEAVSYVLAGRKPSRGPARGLLDPDCLIVASAACFARTQGLTDADLVLICSDNHKDFAVWKKDIESHVIADDIAEQMPCQVQYYKSPRDLVEVALDTAVEADQPLANALDEYEVMTDRISSIATSALLSDYLKQHPALTVNPNLFKGIKFDYPTVTAGMLKEMKLNYPTVNPNLFKGIKLSPAVMAGLFRGIKSTYSPINGDVLKGIRLNYPDLDPDELERLEDRLEEDELDEEAQLEREGMDELPDQEGSPDEDQQPGL